MKAGPKPPLKWPLRLLNAVAAQWPLADRLDVDDLRNAAIEHAGLSDFGDRHFEEGLNRLIASANDDARLHFLGRRVLRALVTVFLTNRLLLAEARKRSPGVFKSYLPPPLVILGLPRSGTTLLHNLLALDPERRAIPAWQLLRPLENGVPDRRRQTYQWENRAQTFLIPRLDRIHRTRTDSPEECVMLLGTTFLSAIFYTCAPVYGYYEWLNREDRLPAYQEYHALLQVLQYPDPSRALVLKSPAHTAAMESLMAVLPGAMVIQTHRHPVTVCNSTNSLIYEMHSLVTEAHDIERMTKVNIDTLVRWTEASMEFRDASDTRVHDVFYDRLVADPIGTVKSIYAYFELEWPAGFETRLRNYIDAHPRGRFGKHHYSGSDFGLDDGETAERFERYIRHFQLNRKLESKG